RKEQADPLMNPQDVMLTAQAKQAQISAEVAKEQANLQVLQIRLGTEQLTFGNVPGFGGLGGGGQGASQQLGPTGTPMTPQQQMGNAKAMDTTRKLQASQQPVLSNENNQPVPGSQESAVQGTQAA